MNSKTVFAGMLLVLFMFQSIIHADIRPVLIKDNLLTRLLVESDVQVLKCKDSSEPLHTIKLYRIAAGGSCFESDAFVCAYRYFLAISDNAGEGQREAVYDLGEVGEIKNLEWTHGYDIKRPPNASKSDTWTEELRFTALNYSEQVFSNMPDVKREEKKVHLDVSTTGITLVP